MIRTEKYNYLINNYKNLKDINNLIYSKKIFLMELFLQIHFLNHFNFFLYRYSIDIRGRKYYESNFSTGNPIIRQLISFYGPPLKDIIENDHLLINTYLETIKNIEKLLLFQIKSIFPTFAPTQKYNFSFDDILSICLNKNNNIKFGLIFKLFNFIFDYKNFMQKPLDHVFISHFTIDASNSGTKC